MCIRDSILAVAAFALSAAVTSTASAEVINTSGVNPSNVTLQGRDANEAVYAPVDQAQLPNALNNAYSLINTFNKGDPTLGIWEEVALFNANDVIQQYPGSKLWADISRSYTNLSAGWWELQNPSRTASYSGDLVVVLTADGNSSAFLFKDVKISELGQMKALWDIGWTVDGVAPKLDQFTLFARNVQAGDPTSVPEPASLAMMFAGAGMITMVRRRSKQAK